MKFDFGLKGFLLFISIWRKFSNKRKSNTLDNARSFILGLHDSHEIHFYAFLIKLTLNANQFYMSFNLNCFQK